MADDEEQVDTGAAEEVEAADDVAAEETVSVGTAIQRLRVAAGTGPRTGGVLLRAGSDDRAPSASYLES